MLNAKELVKAAKDAKHEPTEEQGQSRSVAKLLNWLTSVVDRSEKLEI